MACMRLQGGRHRTLGHPPCHTGSHQQGAVQGACYCRPRLHVDFHFTTYHTFCLSILPAYQPCRSNLPIRPIRPAHQTCLSTLPVQTACQLCLSTLLAKLRGSPVAATAQAGMPVLCQRCVVCVQSNTLFNTMAWTQCTTMCSSCLRPTWCCHHVLK